MREYGVCGVVWMYMPGGLPAGREWCTYLGLPGVSGRLRNRSVMSLGGCC